MFGVTIIEPKEVKEVREGALFMKEVLSSSELKDKMPNFYKLFKNYLDVFYCLIDVISKQDCFYDSVDSRYYIQSYLALRGYATVYSKEYTGSSSNKSTMGLTVLSAVLVGLILKTEFSRLPNQLKESLITYKKTNEYTYRTDVLSLPLFNEKYLALIEDNASRLVLNNFTRKSLSKDFVALNYGVEEAIKTYAQLKPNQKQVSKIAQDILTKASKLIEKDIAKVGYITEKDLVNRLLRNSKKLNKEVTRHEIEVNLSRVVNILCLENNLKRKNLTKLLRSQLNIKESDVRISKKPLIYFR